MASPTRLRLGDITFTWDSEKHRTNLRKHGITFVEAATTWLDVLAIEAFDEGHSGSEDRWLRIGMSVRGALLVVWSSERAGRKDQVLVRIIGARRANRKERLLYEEAEEED